MRSHILKKRKRIGFLTTILRILLVLGFSAAILIIIAVFRIRPMIRPIAIAQAKSIATRAINTAVAAKLSESDITYDDLISLEKDSENRVTALKVNTIEVNKLKSELSVAVLDKVAQLDRTEIKIPLGNIINNELFSNLGPKITVSLNPVGFVETNIINSFFSAGINQTRHQILLEITVTIGIIMPTYTEYASVTTEIVIGESVLLGSVPNSYTNVGADEDSQQLWDKINNFLER